MTEMPDILLFDDVARIPKDGDNVAIIGRRLEAGTTVRRGTQELTLPHTVLEGHRIIVDPIGRGETLLSWGLPFGIALHDLVPGAYVCNASILETLAGRWGDFMLPNEPNFQDHVSTYVLDESAFTPGPQIAPAASPATFGGFGRPGTRGVGTRNFVVVIGMTSRTASFAEALAQRFAEVRQTFPNVDGVVAVKHTEGDGEINPNNRDLMLRTLAGFVIHANVGAVMIADYGSEPITTDTLRTFMREHHYPLSDVLHEFSRIESDTGRALDAAARRIEGWLPAVNAIDRTRTPVSHLKVALQCGGSDAFSGVSGNALAGHVAKLILSHGGSANLAETDELIGAEPYVLENVRDIVTARRFLGMIEKFRSYAHNHGASAEGNPSGGNRYRGLYNITLKSVGAARKRDPDVRLDHVIDYGERMEEPGYYFMDSPGNDLESIAGQVAAGANIIFFITGNGSITNFPFVPTLKFVTTSGRFTMLSDEMDVNAGRYMDGESLEALGEETFELALRTASGEASKGERAGHAQVQIWRDWRRDAPLPNSVQRSAPPTGGQPLATKPGDPISFRFDAYSSTRGYTADQVGLIMPTSLCSGMPANVIAKNLNHRAHEFGVSRFVSLAHTEGCGSANAESLYLQTLAGHVRHRFVKGTVFLEHGCEKTHNDAIRRSLADAGEDTEACGWASIQLDGGSDKVADNVTEWFDTRMGRAPRPDRESVDAGELRLGMMTTGELPSGTGELLAHLARDLVSAGATVVVPDGSSLTACAPWRDDLLADGGDSSPTVAYGNGIEHPGLHVMEAPSSNPMEIMTGLGGTGAEIVLAHIGDCPIPSHPMIPVLQISAMDKVIERYSNDLDLVLDSTSTSRDQREAISRCLAETASGRYQPIAVNRGFTSFQLTRGLLGLSM